MFSIKDTQALIEVHTGAVLAYTATNDNLYFVTSELDIVRSNFDGRDQVTFGKSNGPVSDLDYFDGCINYIENSNRIILMDTESGNCIYSYSADHIRSVYQYDYDKLIWYDADDNPNYLNILTGVSEELQGEFEVNCLTSINSNPSEYQILATDYIFLSVPDVNDVTIPLTEYPASLASVELYQSTGYPTAQSYFSKSTCDHVNGIKNCKSYASCNQCFGFAVYAHDAYYHIFDTEKSSPGWASGDYYTEDVTMGSAEKFRNFLQGLEPGAYIRFGKTGDNIAPEGVHSAMFLYAGDSHALVYECNPDKKCGVHLTTYSYEKLADRYQFIANYVNHSLPGSFAYKDSTYHTRECANCDGYLRQAHDNPKITLRSGAQHSFTSDCCGTVNGAHTEPVKYTYFNELAHTISAACCEGSITRSHNYVNDYCAQCNAHKDNHNIVM